MSHSAWNVEISRRSWLLAGFAIPVFRASGAVSLSVLWDGDNLHVAAPELHFLTGRPLERLRDGSSVLFMAQLTLSTDRMVTVYRRSPDRFVVSYDLWEEKFSVTRLGPSPRSVSNLTAEAAETWCLDNMAISAMGLEPGRPFWMRFELRPAEKEDTAVLGEPGINLTRLIEYFSRRPRAQQPQFTLDAGPMRLGDLKRLPGRQRTG